MFITDFYISDGHIEKESEEYENSKYTGKLPDIYFAIFPIFDFGEKKKFFLHN